MSAKRSVYNSCPATAPYCCGTAIDAAARDAWQREGILRVRAAVPAATLERIHAALTRALGAPPDTPAGWSRFRSEILKPIGRDPACVPVEVEPLRTLVGELLGGPGEELAWQRPRSGGTWFCKPPSADPFQAPDPEQVPREHWHWDGRPDHHDCSGLWAFTLLADLPAGGGGTWLLAGSHAVISDWYAALPADLIGSRTRVLKKRFALAHPWAARLNDGDAGTRFDARAAPGRVVQVQGRAGDVVFMRPLTFHRRPDHVGPGPRLVHMIGISPRHDPVGESPTRPP